MQQLIMNLKNINHTKIPEMLYIELNRGICGCVKHPEDQWNNKLRTIMHQKKS